MKEGVKESEGRNESVKEGVKEREGRRVKDHRCGRFCLVISKARFNILGKCVYPHQKLGCISIY